MGRLLTLFLFALLLLPLQGSPQPAGKNSSPQVSQSESPEYTANGEMVLPTNYREWIYLSSGIDMSYSPNMSMNHSMFDNVFVNPSAYKAFQQTGTWPDKTMLVLESRVAQGAGSINKSGKFQTAEIMGLEVHVKDSRFPGKWAFFAFDNEAPAKQIPVSMPCYTCHQAHGAVDTTFVQFYPTLIKFAKEKGTLSEAYKKEEAVEK